MRVTITPSLWWLFFLVFLLAACSPVALEPAADLAGGPAATGEAYPALIPATATLPPYPWPTVTPPPTSPPDPTEEPTETIPPVPTPPPTPIVTPIPTAAPPIIPFPDGTTAQPFTLYWRDGDVIRSLRSDGEAESSVFLDPAAEFGLFLPPIEANILSWGAISPDGRTLALTLTEEASPATSSPYPVHIYLFDLQSREMRQLAKFGVEPVWSPDSTRLAYSSTETRGLWVVDVIEGKADEIFNIENASEHYVTGMTWSPNNRQIAVIDEQPYASTAIFIVDTDKLEPPKLLEGPFSSWAYNVQWSPTDERISFTSAVDGPGGWQIQIVDLDGKWTQLAGDVYPVSGVPRWSPNGQWIAFGGVAIYESAHYQTDLWLTDSFGKSLIRLTFDAAQIKNDIQTENSRPLWSPDGTQLLFRKAEEIWLLSLLDNSQRKLLSLPNSSEIGLVITR